MMWNITGGGTFTLTPIGERFFAELQSELAERDKPVITIREFDDPSPLPTTGERAGEEGRGE
jgi:hypothetical protein